MPKAFSEQEKGRIRKRLLEAGRSCFLRYGLKKTTIEDVVQPAGIAKSSFYLFFESKEALYVELIMAEMPSMMQRLIEASFGATDDTREALVLLIKRIVTEIETNEFARIMLDNPSELEQLAASIDFGGILQRSAAFYAPLVEKIVEAQERGDIISGDPRQIMYSLGLIKLLAFNRDRIPTELYESMIEFVPEVIADGLTCLAQTKKMTGGTQPSKATQQKEDR